MAESAEGAPRSGAGAEAEATPNGEPDGGESGGGQSGGGEPEDGESGDGEASGESGARAQGPRGVGRLIYKLALAGVGGVIFAQEEISDFFRRGADGAIEGPEQREQDGDDEPAQEPAAGTPGHRWTERVDLGIDRVLRTLSVPSRADVDELSRRVDALAARVRERRGG